MIKMLNSLLDRFIDYMIETFWNKVCALAVALCGTFLFVVSGELVIMIIVAVLAIALFFARENWINI